MIPCVRRSALAWAILALAALTFAPDHTDDGCQVEMHCLACRTALASLGGEPAVPEALPAPIDFERVVEAAAPLWPAEPLPSTDSSRGPPVAA